MKYDKNEMSSDIARAKNYISSVILRDVDYAIRTYNKINRDLLENYPVRTNEMEIMICNFEEWFDGLILSREK